MDIGEGGDVTPRTDLSNAYGEFKTAASPEDSIRARKRVLEARETLLRIDDLDKSTSAEVEEQADKEIPADILDQQQHDRLEDVVERLLSAEQDDLAQLLADSIENLIDGPCTSEQLRQMAADAQLISDKLIQLGLDAEGGVVAELVAVCTQLVSTQEAGQASRALPANGAVTREVFTNLLSEATNGAAEERKQEGAGMNEQGEHQTEVEGGVTLLGLTDFFRQKVADQIGLPLTIKLVEHLCQEEARQQMTCQLPENAKTEENTTTDCDVGLTVIRVFTLLADNGETISAERLEAIWGMDGGVCNAELLAEGSVVGLITLNEWMQFWDKVGKERGEEIVSTQMHILYKTIQLQDPLSFTISPDCPATEQLFTEELRALVRSVCQSLLLKF